MDFGDPCADGFDGVENGHGRVRVGRRVEDNGVEFAARFLYPIDERPFVVRLPDVYFGSECRGFAAAAFSSRSRSAQRSEFLAIF